jgi:transposase-like protein
MNEQPKTLIEITRHFSNPQIGKPVCPKCGGLEHYYLATQSRWKCKACSKQFSVKVGTIFEDSPITLDKWLVTLWMIVNCKNGISSYEVAAHVGVTQKTAWFMLQRLRKVLQDDFNGGKLSGEVEVDETFIGGKARNMHKSKRVKRITGRGATGKTVVMGMLERGGKVKTLVVPDRSKTTLQGHVINHVEEGTEVFTDELLSYWGLDEKYTHQIINHAEEYVRGNIHTNGMENFWSLLKRSLGGTYVAVEPFHLFRYIDEQAFRFNNREGKSNADRFGIALSQVAGKRLTYAEVTGQVGVRA